MIKFRPLAVLCLTGLVAGCGGGGGGGGLGSTPTPPAAPRNSTLTNLQFSETFQGSEGEISYRISGSTGGATQRGSAAVQSTNAATVRYDAATQSYTVSGIAITPPTFGSAERDATSSTAVISAYGRKTGSKQENLALFNPGAGNTELALTYTSYGGYQAVTSGTNSADVDTAFFTYGIKTASSDMPRSGSATYTSKIDGQFADTTGAYVLGGSSSFAADFAAATIAFSLTPVGQNVVTRQIKNFAPRTIAGKIESVPAGQQFSGDVQGSDGYRTAVQGYFYGPAAAEIGGTFSLVGNQGFGTGIVVGRKN